LEDFNTYNEKTVTQKDDERKGIIISALVHILLLLICIMPVLTYWDPPREISGILVQFGDDISEGGSDQIPESSVDQVENEIQTPTKSNPTPTEVAKKESPLDESEADLQEESPVVKKENTSNTKTAEQIAEEKRRKEAEELQKQKDAQEAQKKKYADLLKNSSGKGNNSNTGNEGSKNGRPDSSVLDNLSAGAGDIGGDVSNRKVVFQPTIRDNSQKTGTVMVSFCVDSKGNVTKASFTQKGSTTTDSHLIAVACAGVKKYKFNIAEAQEQCGRIPIIFEVE